MPVLKTGSCLLHRRPESQAASMIGKSEVPGNNLTEGFLFRENESGKLGKQIQDLFAASDQEMMSMDTGGVCPFDMHQGIVDKEGFGGDEAVLVQHHLEDGRIRF